MNEPSDYAENLRRAITASGKSQAEVARAVEVSPAVVYQWITGRRPVPAYKAVRLAACTGYVLPEDISESYRRLAQEKAMAQEGTLRSAREPSIAAYEIREVEDDIAENDGDILIDEVEVRLSAGNGAAVPEFVPTKRRLAFARSWLQKKRLSAKHLRVMPIHGDSMLPTLSSGDTVLVDLSDKRIVDGKIYAFVVGREARIKRLRWRADGSLVVISDNPDKVTYPNDIIDAQAADDLYLLGRAVQRSGDL